MSERYLWDRSGPPDPEVERLERLLAPLAFKGGPAPTPRRRRGPAWWGVAAATLAVAAALGHGVVTREGLRWKVVTLAGLPSVGGGRDDGTLGPGGHVETDAGSRARLALNRLGEVVVEPGSRLRVVRTSWREQRLALERGRIAARTLVPPRRFFVETPAGVAVDLGCAFELESDDEGHGRLVVTSGLVAFDSGGRRSVVPAGGRCRIHAEKGPGTPHRVAASPRFVAALDRLDFGEATDRALEDVLNLAEPADALSLWHLLPRWAGARRVTIYERMAELAPPPARVDRAGVLALHEGCLARWSWALQRPWRAENPG